MIYIFLALFRNLKIPELLQPFLLLALSSPFWGLGILFKEGNVRSLAWKIQLVLGFLYLFLPICIPFIDVSFRPSSLGVALAVFIVLASYGNLLKTRWDVKSQGGEASVEVKRADDERGSMEE